MTEFVASNGVKIISDGSGCLQIGSLILGVSLVADEASALREYFRHEYDERLGLWRDPAYPDLFVREHGPDLVAVVKNDESGLAYGQFKRGDLLSLRNSCDPMNRAAAAYFDAHPGEPTFQDQFARLEIGDRFRVQWNVAGVGTPGVKVEADLYYSPTTRGLWAASKQDPKYRIIEVNGERVCS